MHPTIARASGPIIPAARERTRLPGHPFLKVSAAFLFFPNLHWISPSFRFLMNDMAGDGGHSTRLASWANSRCGKRARAGTMGAGLRGGVAGGTRGRVALTATAQTAWRDPNVQRVFLPASGPYQAVRLCKHSIQFSVLLSKSSSMTFTIRPMLCRARHTRAAGSRIRGPAATRRARPAWRRESGIGGGNAGSGMTAAPPGDSRYDRCERIGARRRHRRGDTFPRPRRSRFQPGAILPTLCAPAPKEPMRHAERSSPHSCRREPSEAGLKKSIV